MLPFLPFNISGAILYHTHIISHSVTVEITFAIQQDTRYFKPRGGQYLKYLYLKFVFQILFTFSIWHMTYFQMNILYFGI